MFKNLLPPKTLTAAPHKSGNKPIHSGPLMRQIRQQSSICGELHRYGVANDYSNTVLLKELGPLWHPD